MSSPSPPASAKISAPSSCPSRVTNPTGDRVAQLARTFPPRFPRLRFLALDRKPTTEEWARMQDYFKANPEQRIRRGEQHMDGENRYFIAYDRSCINGERWGTKEQLAKARASANKANRQARKRKMQTDPIYRAASLARLAQLQGRQEAIDEAVEAAKMRKSRARRLAAASIRRKKRRH